MADTFTSHYNLTKPQIGADPDTWGTLLNTNFDTIDSQMYANAQAAAAALPLVGGTLTGALILQPASGQTSVTLSTAAGNSRYVVFSTGATERWAINGADNSAESGSNAGSNFLIGRFSDAGAFIDFPLQITRSTGAVTLTGVLNLTPASSDATFNISKPNGNKAAIFGMTAGLMRWQLTLGSAATESGSNVGSDFNIARFNDAGTLIDVPFAITRSSGLVTFGSGGTTTPGAVAAGSGFVSTNTNYIAATSGSGGTVYLRPNGVGSATGQMTLNSSGVAAAADFQATSDERLKTNIRKLRRGIDELKRMLPREYIKAGREEVGFIAQEVQQVLPEAVGENGEGFLTVSDRQVLALVASAVLELDRRMALEGF